MTVPMGFVRGNLPAGLQILGRPRSSAKHMLTLPVGVDGGATGPHVVRMRRSIRIVNPLVPAAERSRGPAFAITSSQPTLRWRELDSNFRFRARFGLVFVVSLFVLHFVAEA